MCKRCHGTGLETERTYPRHDYLSVSVTSICDCAAGVAYRLSVLERRAQPREVGEWPADQPDTRPAYHARY